MTSSSVFRCCVVIFALVFPCVVIGYALFLMITKQSASDTIPSSTTGTRVVPSLEFVIVLTRHGNRRPLFSFPNDPYPDKYWNCELGEITKQGKIEMFNIGKKIRSLYNGFLNSTYSSNDFYATSTALERTLVSGEAFLAGLYPPRDEQIWNEDIPWQPIPIFTDSPDGSQIGNYPCPRFAYERNITSTKLYEDYGDMFSKVDSYLSKYSGGNSSKANFLYSIWDSLFSEETEGFILPEWTKEVYPNPLNYLIMLEFIAVSAGTDTLTRLISSALWIEITNLIQGKINGTLTPDYKMYYYSSHDMTLVSLQAVLGIPKSLINGLINPGSALIYELHRDPDAGSHHVQVLYIDGLSPQLQPVAVNIPDCHNSSCPFLQLLDITAKFRNFTSEHDECYRNQ